RACTSLCSATGDAIALTIADGAMVEYNGVRFAVTGGCPGSIPRTFKSAEYKIRSSISSTIGGAGGRGRFIGHALLPQQLSAWTQSGAVHLRQNKLSGPRYHF